MEAPTLPRDALHLATITIGNLLQRIPGAKAGDVLQTLDAIEEFWAKQDRDQFPFNSLVSEIAAIKTQIRESYKDDLRLEIDRASFTYDQLIGFNHRLRNVSESILFNPIFAGLERRLQRLEDVLPPRNYAVKELLGDLRVSFNPALRQRIETAFERFERQEFESTIEECGKARAILFEDFKKYLTGLGIGGLSDNIGPALQEIRRKMESALDLEGLPLSTSGRLERLLVSMIESLHYFRNLVAHDRVEERSQEKIPAWQIKRREIFVQRPEYARLVLLLTVQIAVELQFLMDHQRV